MCRLFPVLGQGCDTVSGNGGTWSRSAGGRGLSWAVRARYLAACRLASPTPLRHCAGVLPFTEKIRFLSAFVARPNSVGAVAPSSRELALRMVEWIDWDAVGAVVEYGPGLGAITSEVLRAKKPEAHLFVIEKEPAFVGKLRERFPDLTIYQRCALDVESLCRQEGLNQVDAIVSGLPWAAFSAGLQTQLLDAMMTVLKRGGQFVTFAYLHGLLLPGGVRFRRQLDRYFGEVSISPVVWRNLPPAIVYRCRAGVRLAGLQKRQ